MSLIYTFTWPAISTLVLLIAELFYKKRKNEPWYYIQFFLIIWSVALFFFMAQAEAHQPPQKQKIYIPETYAVTYHDLVTYELLYNENLENGYKFFNSAQNRCIFFPKRTDREKAQECFRIAVSTIASLGDWKVVIGNIIISLGNYGLDVYEAYTQMENDLQWSEYHFDMALFYLDILIRYGWKPLDAYKITQFEILRSTLRSSRL